MRARAKGPPLDEGQRTLTPRDIFRNAGPVILARRLVSMAALLAVLSVALFYLLHLMPGSPEEMLVASNPDLTSEDLERLRRLRGLDRPIHERYFCWLVGRGGGSRGEGGVCAGWPSEGGVLGGDLGHSTVHKLPVSALLRARIPSSLGVMLPALALSLFLAIPLGAFQAARHRRFQDRVLSAMTSLFVAIPTHWLGMVAVLVFSVWLGWLPAGGIEDIAARGGDGWRSRFLHSVLPVAVLSVFYIGRWSRYVRASTLEVSGCDYIRTARAKGLSERAIFWRHVLPNAQIPLVTVVAQSIPTLFSGVLVIERVFGYPGMGALIFESVERRDHLVAMIVFLVYAALTMLATLIADALYLLLDPRIRVGTPIEASGSS